jgi:hypothetical protein
MPCVPVTALSALCTCGVHGIVQCAVHCTVRCAVHCAVHCAVPCTVRCAVPCTVHCPVLEAHRVLPVALPLKGRVHGLHPTVWSLLPDPGCWPIVGLTANAQAFYVMWAEL